MCDLGVAQASRARAIGRLIGVSRCQVGEIGVGRDPGARLTFEVWP
jgi:hypothetical protein